MDTTIQLPAANETVSRDRLLTRLLLIITVLLFLLVGLTVYTMVKQQQMLERIAVSVETVEAQAETLERIAASVEAAEVRALAKDKKLRAISGIASRQDDLIADLLESYQADAYDNPSLERITEQQLIAAEYQLTALQLIALQNGEIIQLLAITP